MAVSEAGVSAIGGEGSTVKGAQTGGSGYLCRRPREEDCEPWGLYNGYDNGLHEGPLRVDDRHRQSTGYRDL